MWIIDWMMPEGMAPFDAFEKASLLLFVCDFN
jgi:hypothetical protein